MKIIKAMLLELIAATAYHFQYKLKWVSVPVPKNAPPKSPKYQLPSQVSKTHRLCSPKRLWYWFSGFCEELNPCKCQCFPHIKTSHLICTADQLTGFYMRATLSLNVLKSITLYNQIHQFCDNKLQKLKWISTFFMKKFQKNIRLPQRYPAFSLSLIQCCAKCGKTMPGSGDQEWPNKLTTNIE